MENMPNVLMSYLRVTQHMSQQFRAHFGKLNLTFPQALVLNVLGEEGPIPISALAERTGSANSTVSGIVDRLEKLGLAQRKRSEQDRRVIYVEATQQYHELRKKAETNVSGYFNSLLGDMTPEDRAQVAEAFCKLDAVLTARTEGAE
ncbi:MAG TPA: MarR family transcriptional regulator [Candidatus Flavonifractor intestinipullorum]|uniref:MarR family transcriptional regulator n=1 Tax=Candidatus Flavonifractor intestinipullorum TaxID=2838587 RepID=A0A9D2S4L0_9FIRM|nr:MarR family transcriptional regulator [Candidatus Flavonifractor intestinipullorum]